MLAELTLPKQAYEVIRSAVPVRSRDRTFWDSIFLVSVLYGKHQKRSPALRDCWHHLMAQILGRVMRKNTLKQTVALLGDLGIISVTHGYQAGCESKAYKLQKAYQDAESITIQVTSKVFAKKVLSDRERAKANYALVRDPIAVKINEKMQQIEPGEQFGSLSRLQQRIVTGNMKTMIGPTNGRFTTPFACATPEERKQVRVEGEEVTGLDIANCQPAILAYLTEQSIRESEQENTWRDDASRFNWCLGCRIEDAQRFASDAANGEFYGRLQSELRDEYGIRLSDKDTKIGVLRDVFANKQIRSRGRWMPYPSDMRSVFKKLYGGVVQFIDHTNRFNYTETILRLQRAEVKFVIYTVCPIILQRYPAMFFTPVHDSIYCKLSDAFRVRECFDIASKQTGFRFKLKGAA